LCVSSSLFFPSSSLCLSRSLLSLVFSLARYCFLMLSGLSLLCFDAGIVVFGALEDLMMGDWLIKTRVSPV